MNGDAGMSRGRAKPPAKPAPVSDDETLEKIYIDELTKCSELDKTLTECRRAGLRAVAEHARDELMKKLTSKDGHSAAQEEWTYSTNENNYADWCAMIQAAASVKVEAREPSPLERAHAKIVDENTALRARVAELEKRAGNAT